MKDITRDDFPLSVKNKIAARVGYRCSKCSRPTSGPGDDGKTLNTGIAAHICAASAGGPRYDVNQTTEERKGIDNGIWLCVLCSKIVDINILEFSVERLTKLKFSAEILARSAQRDNLYSDQDLASPKAKGMRLSYVELTPTSPNKTSFKLSLNNIDNDPIVWMSLLIVFCKEIQDGAELIISRTSYQILNDVSPIDKDRTASVSFDANGLGLSDLHETTIVVWGKYAHSTSRMPVYFNEVSRFEISSGILKRTIQPNPLREKFLDFVRENKMANVEEIENSNPYIAEI
jgi:hypothetical protein